MTYSQVLETFLSLDNYVNINESEMKSIVDGRTIYVLIDKLAKHIDYKLFTIYTKDIKHFADRSEFVVAAYDLRDAANQVRASNFIYKVNGRMRFTRLDDFLRYHIDDSEECKDEEVIKYVKQQYPDYQVK